MKSLIVYIESKIYAIKRRLFLITYNKFDPYPKNYADFKLDPKLIVENYFNQIKNKNKINKAENNLILIKAPHGHTYYPDLLWPTIMKYFS